ncbi:hypothetical protein KQI58_00805 [Enterococcus raffinosus]|uniref:hypothetical protein n=1 Tax=Enterococcus raffinosus TaxID=71452 RepID=UPI001C115371|nr:hypothetical protein [Enterococcus raffinosus]MBU5359609.1 hypothetical protein [Enterococcus raffinosus]
MNSMIKSKLKPKPFTKKDFENFDGYFLFPEIANKMFVTNFEYTAAGVEHTDVSHIGFVAFTTKRMRESLGIKREWPDGNEVVKRDPQKFEVLVTENPIDSLKKTIPQFIVPNTWEFMYQVGDILE